MKSDCRFIDFFFLNIKVTSSNKNIGVKEIKKIMLHNCLGVGYEVRSPISL